MDTSCSDGEEMTLDAEKMTLDAEETGGDDRGYGDDEEVTPDATEFPGKIMYDSYIC